MLPIPAVYENGVFRPIGPVSLPEFSRVEVSVPAVSRLPEKTDAEIEATNAVLYDILTSNGDSGESRIAETHNEYHP